MNKDPDMRSCAVVAVEIAGLEARVVCSCGWRSDANVSDEPGAEALSGEEKGRAQHEEHLSS